MKDDIDRHALRATCKSMIREGVPVKEALEIFEDELVNQLLLKSKGNVTNAARMGGVHRNTIHRKLRIR